MKNLFNCGLACLLAMTAVSCGSSKKAAASSSEPAVKSSVSAVQTVEGNIELSEDIVWSDVDEGKSVSEDGLRIVYVPYKWFLGLGQSKNKQIAIEEAQREAYATIARVMNTTVKSEAEKGSLKNNDPVQQALKTHWTQFSEAVLTACEPFGAVNVTYDQNAQVYKAKAKVGVTVVRYNKMLDSAGAAAPANLTEEQTKQFAEINRSIIEAAKVQ